MPFPPRDCPPEPWLASRLEPDARHVAVNAPQQLARIRSAERVIAWAFLELIETEKRMKANPTKPTGPTVTLGGKKLALRPATREEARRSQANVLRRHAVALNNLKNR